MLFGVPGAFTPVCSNTHLPGFVKHAADFKAKGVDKVACVAVNDPAVMGAWGKAQGAGDKVVMLSDGNAKFAKAAGLAGGPGRRGHGHAQPPLRDGGEGRQGRGARGRGEALRLRRLRRAEEILAQGLIPPRGAVAPALPTV